MTNIRYVVARVVLTDGSSVTLSDLEWDVSRFARAGSFSFRVPADATLAARFTSAATQGSRLALDASVATTSGGPIWQRVCVGIADRLSWDPVSGVLSCEGRDLAALLIDFRVPDSYLNQTSSEIAAGLAAACGLQSNVISTRTIVGQYYQIEHRRAPFVTYSGRATAWDMLTELATLENYQLGVTNEILSFVPAGVHDVLAAVWMLAANVWQASTGPELEHVEFGMLPAIKKVSQVRVRSWNSRQRMLVDTAPDAGSDGTYDVIRPNMLNDDATRLASSLLGRVVTRASSVQMSLPGELTLLPGQLVQFLGTGSVWDRSYRIDEISRSISVRGGFQQTMTASAVSQG